MSGLSSHAGRRLFPLPDEFAFVEEPLPLTTPARTWAESLHRVKGMERELAESFAASDDARRKMLISLIEEVMDNLDRALQSVEEETEGGNPWFRRMRQARTLALKVLAQENVTPLDLTAAPPGMVSILETVPSRTVPLGQIAEVVVRGYLWNGGILRRAVVKVSSGLDPSDSGSGTPEGAESNG